MAASLVADPRRRGVVLTGADGTATDPGRLGPLGGALEAAGIEAIWVADHVVWPVPVLDCLGAVVALAGATSSAVVGPGVVQLPLRGWAPTFRALAMADGLAPGRVVCGVGAGEHEAEYRAAGVTFAGRGRVLDAGIDALRAAWPERRGSDRGRGPTGHLPIWVGGRGDRSLARAARQGDGWMPHLCRPGWFARRNAALDEAVAAAGREPGAVRRGVVVAVSVDEVAVTDPAADLARYYGTEPRAFARVLVRGGAADCVEELRRFEAAGAEHLAILPAGADPLAVVGALVGAGW